MKLTAAIVIFASTIATANGKRRRLRRELELEESSYSMSMPEALDIDAMKGSGSSKAGKEPVGAEVFVGTYYFGSSTDAPLYKLTSPVIPNPAPPPTNLRLYELLHV